MMAVSVWNPAACLFRSSSLPACTIALAANFQGSSRNLLFGPRNRWSSGLQSTSASVKCGSGRRRLAVSCKATEITEREFEEAVLKSDSPVLVEFIASWCGPCRLISPIVDWASEEYKGRLKVVKIDHDANPKLIDEYKVYGLPALILFKNGEEVPESRREGAMTKEKLKAYLDALLESVTAA